MLKHGTGLFQGDSGEPLDKLVDGSVVFKVLEQGSDRDAGALENPGPTDASGVAFNGLARGPVDHGADGSTGWVS
jgi:hypothetical protein